MWAALMVSGGGWLEGVTAAVVGLRVQTAAPHKGAERVSLCHQDHGVDEFGQRPARLCSGTNQLLQDGREEGRGYSLLADKQFEHLLFMLLSE